MNRIAQQVEAWVVSYFSSEFHLAPERVIAAEGSLLSDWGYADEKALAFLAGSFNQAARTRPGWRNAHVTPPELVSAVKGGTIHDLIIILISVVRGS